MLISRKELWRQQEEQFLQRDLGFVIRDISKLQSDCEMLRIEGGIPLLV